MTPITVLVHGALGKMGKEVTAAVCRDPELEMGGAVDIQATSEYFDLPDTSKKVPLSSNLNALLQICHPDVIVDFTNAEAAIVAARIALKNKINVVIGSSGISDDNLKEIDSAATANKIGAVVAPNFALGAVVLMHLAEIAAKFFENVEIIELHHNKKIDAPSGTALATAKALLEAKGSPFSYTPTEKDNLSGSRGGQTGGISIHSVRLPGIVASQEVIFGTTAQTLSLRHDTTSRESFMPGVILAIKEVVKRQGLVYGLDTLLNLKGEWRI